MHRHSRIFDQVKWVEDINIRRLAIGDEKNRAVVAGLTLHYRRGMPQCSADVSGQREDGRGKRDPGYVLIGGAES